MKFAPTADVQEVPDVSVANGEESGQRCSQEVLVLRLAVGVVDMVKRAELGHAVNGLLMRRTRKNDGIDVHHIVWWQEASISSHLKVVDVLPLLQKLLCPVICSTSASACGC